MTDATATRPRTILEDIQQTKPFRSLSQEAFLGMLRTADDFKRRVGEALEPHAITTQQYNVLRILRGAGDEGIPTLMIGERMIERTPGVTRLIDRMEKRGWVVRKRCTEDRRRVWCRVTQEGLGLLDSLDDILNAVDDSLGVALEPSELTQFTEYLDRLRAAVNE
ncbi:MAG: MarR family winged helix-turn-helix transcriptional regulator [Longimicrobiales bacterium]|jgi:DNA-binding MarR family transcriptional regulator